MLALHLYGHLATTTKAWDYFANLTSGALDPWDRVWTAPQRQYADTLIRCGARPDSARPASARPALARHVFRKSSSPQAHPPPHPLVGASLMPWVRRPSGVWLTQRGPHQRAVLPPGDHPYLRAGREWLFCSLSGVMNATSSVDVGSASGGASVPFPRGFPNVLLGQREWASPPPPEAAAPPKAAGGSGPPRLILNTKSKMNAPRP